MPGCHRSRGAWLSALLIAVAMAAMAHAEDGLGAFAAEAGPGVPVFGYVLWPGHDVSASQVRFCSDDRCRDVVTCAEASGPNGAVFSALDPGRYFVMAISDVDGDGRIGPGDGLGFYGAYQQTDAPMALVVEEGAEAVEVNVPVSFVIDKDMHLVAERVLPPPPLVVEDQSRVSGVVTGVTGADAVYVVLVPLVPAYPARACTVAPGGTFALDAAPGTYHLLAVQVGEKADRVGVGDCVALHAQSEGRAPGAALLRIAAGQPVSDLSLAMDWRVAADGRLRSLDGALLGPRLQAGNLPGVCSGTVSRQGQAIGGALVQASATGSSGVPLYSTRTDGEGRFCLGLAAGAYRLTATRDGNGDGQGGPDEPQAVVKTANGQDADDLLVRPGSVARGLTAELP